MEHNGNNDINGSAVYGEGSPSELNCGLMEGNNMSLKKGPWTAVEDRSLMEYVSKHGEGNWNAVQRKSGLKRCGKSCRLRWANHLRPNLKKGQFTPEEERLILELQAKYGNKWARMASQLPGRTDNEIKNYWNTRVKKRLRKGLPLYPHDINPSKRACHSHSYSQENTMGVTQLAPNTIPHADTNFSFQSQASSSQNQSQVPPRLSQNRHNSTVSALDHSLPLYDPTTSVPSFDCNQNAPMLGVPLGYKRYQEDIGFSPPNSPTTESNSSMLRTSSMPEIASCQQFARGSSSMHDISSFHFQTQASNESFLPLSRTSNNQFNFGDSLSSPSRSFYSMSSEHPSRQVSMTPEPPSYHVSQTPQLPSSQASQTQSFSDNNTTIHANINATHCGDGFLEQLLLQEAEAFGYGSHLIRKPIGHLDSYEKYHDLDGYDHSLPSTTMDSSLRGTNVFLKKPTQDNDEHITSRPKYLAKVFSFNSTTELMSNSNDEMKPSPDLEHMNSIPKYLSKLLSFNLSTEQMTNSHNGESTKLPNSQSSGVPEANLEFAMQHHMDSLFPAANSWDNMAETSVEKSRSCGLLWDTQYANSYHGYDGVYLLAAISQ